MYLNLKDATSMKVGAKDVVRIWYKGQIVWPYPKDYLWLNQIGTTSIYLPIEQSLNNFNVLSNTTWSFNTQ